MSLLQVKGLRRDYGSLRAVDDVSFELAAGTILGLHRAQRRGQEHHHAHSSPRSTRPTAGEVLLDGQSRGRRAGQGPAAASATCRTATAPTTT